MASSEQPVTFRERIAKSFTPHRPIDLPEFFLGRKNLLDRAIDAANTAGLHLVLFGDRGTGKTSIAHVLAYMLQDASHPVGRRAIVVSCSSSDDFASIWRKVSQEILLAQRQLGFAEQALASIVGRLDVETTIRDPNDARIFVASLPNPTVIIIDEFDRVSAEGGVSRLMADTIELFSDTNVRSTLVLVGVAESIGGLITEHESVSRNLAQIKVERMTPEELAEIVRKGLERAGLTYAPGVPERIAELSQGYPHFTHLLGLWAARHTLDAGHITLTAADVDAAIFDAIENATGGLQQEYEKATGSARKNNLFRQVLLSCALATKDSLGRFSTVDVRDPLQKVTGQRYEISAYLSHLAKFCDPSRGPVLRRSGSRRSYRWHFTNP
jgi:Cdc6-like AAA superfamily ATPase